MPRKCYVCGLERPAEEFARDKSKASGRKSVCRECDSAKSRRYYEANKDLVYVRITAEGSPPRMCENGCGREATSSRHWYCGRCREAKRRAKAARSTPKTGTTTERGYGVEHQRLRRQLARLVAAGGAVCVRCGELIPPGEPWDLGHDDDDRSRHSGVEHRKCNRATASRRPVRSRDW